MKLPDEITIKDRGCTLDMYNDRGSSRLLDIYVDKTMIFCQMDLNAVNGALDIGFNDQVLKLSPYQVQSLIQFLSQRD